jgi:hypothetical protein
MSVKIGNEYRYDDNYTCYSNALLTNFIEIDVIDKIWIDYRPRDWKFTEEENLKLPNRRKVSVEEEGKYQLEWMNENFTLNEALDILRLQGKISSNPNINISSNGRFLNEEDFLLDIKTLNEMNIKNLKISTIQIGGSKSKIYLEDKEY